MLRVLTACAASVRTSLQGLDYIASYGAKGFEDLCRIVETLKESGLDRETAKRWEMCLKEGNSISRLTISYNWPFTIVMKLSVLLLSLSPPPNTRRAR